MILTGNQMVSKFLQCLKPLNQIKLFPYFTRYHLITHTVTNRHLAQLSSFERVGLSNTFYPSASAG